MPSLYPNEGNVIANAVLRFLIIGSIFFAGQVTGSSLPGLNDIKYTLLTLTENVASVKEIPASVLAELGKISGEKDFRLADIGQPYNSGDIIYPGKLKRRLRFAARSATDILVCYDRGGYQHGVCAALVRISIPHSDEGGIYWSALVNNDVKNLNDFKQAVAEGRVYPIELIFREF